MGRNSRERLKAKRKAAEAGRRRRPGTQAGDADPFGLFGSFDPPSPAQLADELISQAIQARHRGLPAELGRIHGLLTAGLGGPSGRQVVNRALFSAMSRDVERAWKRGWQPAELVRQARRAYTARHGQLLADAIAAQLRRYPAATVDPRWQAQLDAIEARVWWEHDDHYLDAWGERHAVDRGGVVDHLIEVLHLLAMLPSVEPAGPVPGDARPAGPAATGADADIDQRMLDRVRALLAKAESTEFEEEADAFTAKAQQLMARHRIDHALLAAKTGDREWPATRRVAVDNPYEAPKSLLLQVVADANSCRAVWSKQFGFTTIVGFPADLDSTELLFTSLLVQATRAMTQVKPRQDPSGRNNTRSFRQSFLTAYASRIGERLNSAAEEVDREMSSSAVGAELVPVLAARDQAVQEAFETQFPELTQQAATISNQEGWASGRAAADRASLQGRQTIAG